MILNIIKTTFRVITFIRLCWVALSWMSLCWLSLWWMSWRQFNVWNKIFLTIHFKSTVSEFSFDIYVSQSLVKWSQSRDKCKSSAVISDFECFVLSKMGAKTFSKTTLGITTFSKMTRSITIKNATLSIIKLSLMTDCSNAECHLCWESQWCHSCRVSLWWVSQMSP